MNAERFASARMPRIVTEVVRYSTVFHRQRMALQELQLAVFQAADATSAFHLL
jgi:hypothetical protein